MKKLLVFFFAEIMLASVFLSFSPVCAVAHAYKEVAVVSHKNINYELDLSCDDVSVLRSSINKMSLDEQVNIVKKIQSMGFTLQEALCYVFPNLEKSVNKVSMELLIKPVEPAVFAQDNNCKIMFQNAKNGLKIDKNTLFSDFFEWMQSGRKFGVNFIVTYPEISLEQLRKDYTLVSKFKTGYSSSSDARKNNIQLACASINGKFIKSGETFSFNQATGLRSEENGYKSAKIIENGAYVDGFGGGVCQVSSTLYNACLLAGLDAVEVHNHSLPTSYVDPGFDAMVSMGSSDLKIKNNTTKDFLITTSSNQDCCCVCIYGTKPDYEIKARFEKYEDILAVDDKVAFDVLKHDTSYEPGEHRLSYGVDGYKAKGYLDYYTDGILVKSVLIRDSVYKPKNGVVVVV